MCAKDLDFTDVLKKAEAAYPVGGRAEFEVQVDDQLTLAGTIRLIQNEFTKMPRG